MIELLIDKIILYEDRIEIFYICGNNTDPDEPNLEVHRDFFLSDQKIKITGRGFEATFELYYKYGNFIIDEYTYDLRLARLPTRKRRSNVTHSHPEGQGLRE